MAAKTKKKKAIQAEDICGKFTDPRPRSCPSCGGDDVKNEGCIDAKYSPDGKRRWEYHCYSCHKTFTEKE